jgi:NADPH:quinone reductase-like Zn-dependent oxidoreductase
MLIHVQDVLVSMGMVDGDSVDGKGLGCECSGVIKSVGPDVQDLAVGDRVCVAGPDTYTTILRTTSDHCAKMPDTLSFSDAATMPCVYTTVTYGLLDLAHLEAGQVSQRYGRKARSKLTLHRAY